MGINYQFSGSVSYPGFEREVYESRFSSKKGEKYYGK